MLEVDPTRKKLVLSPRLATQAVSLSQLEIGQLVSGAIAKDGQTIRMAISSGLGSFPKTTFSVTNALNFEPGEVITIRV